MIKKYQDRTCVQSDPRQIGRQPERISSQPYQFVEVFVILRICICLRVCHHERVTSQPYKFLEVFVILFWKEFFSRFQEVLFWKNVLIVNVVSRGILPVSPEEEGWL